jgi:hypothetical protein
MTNIATVSNMINMQSEYLERFNKAQKENDIKSIMWMLDQPLYQENIKHLQPRVFDYIRKTNMITEIEQICQDIQPEMLIQAYLQSNNSDVFKKWFQTEIASWSDKKILITLLNTFNHSKIVEYAQNYRQLFNKYYTYVQTYYFKTIMTGKYKRATNLKEFIGDDLSLYNDQYYEIIKKQNVKVLQYIINNYPDNIQEYRRTMYIFDAVELYTYVIPETKTEIVKATRKACSSSSLKILKLLIEKYNVTINASDVKILNIPFAEWFYQTYPELFNKLDKKNLITDVCRNGDYETFRWLLEKTKYSGMEWSRNLIFAYTNCNLDIIKYITEHYLVYNWDHVLGVRDTYNMGIVLWAINNKYVDPYVNDVYSVCCARYGNIMMEWFAEKYPGLDTNDNIGKIIYYGLLYENRNKNTRLFIKNIIDNYPDANICINDCKIVLNDLYNGLFIKNLVEMTFVWDPIFIAASEHNVYVFSKHQLESYFLGMHNEIYVYGRSLSNNTDSSMEQAIELYNQRHISATKKSATITKN